jgi:NADH-quinone oxidoreductase subunit F
VFGSKRGFIYIRGEYRNIQKVFQQALDNAVKAGYLGEKILGIEGFDYNITIISGGGAYVCGESSALLNSAEGKAGRPRVKPPHLAEVGLYSMPTLVNNVESYALATVIVNEGAEAFKAMGTEQSGGTKLISISGHVKNRGVYEIGLGKVTLRDILYDEELGGGSSTGRPIKFYHLGGQSGPIGFPEQLDTLYDHNSLKAAGLSVGSGAVVALDDSVCLVDYCRKVMEFFVHESCGKCAPCRLGTTRCLELLTKLCNGEGKPGDVAKLEDSIRQIAALSACGLGQSVDKALFSCLKHHREEFLAHENGTCPCGGCKKCGK